MRNGKRAVWRSWLPRFIRQLTRDDTKNPDSRIPETDFPESIQRDLNTPFLLALRSFFSLPAEDQPRPGPQIQILQIEQQRPCSDMICSENQALLISEQQRPRAAEILQLHAALRVSALLMTEEQKPTRCKLLSGCQALFMS